MLRVALVVSVATGAGLAACGDDEPDPAADLAAMVVTAIRSDPSAVSERLDELGVVDPAAVIAAVEADDLTCPDVADPAPGDRASCDLDLDGEQATVEIVFDEAGGVQVVGLDVEP